MTTENIKESHAPRGAREPFFLARLADPLSLGGCVGLNFASAPSSPVGVVIGRSTRSLIAGAKRSPHSDIQDSRMRATLVRLKPNAQTREPRHADAQNQTLGYSGSNTCTFQIRHLALRPPKPTTRTFKTRRAPNHSKTSTHLRRTRRSDTHNPTLGNSKYDAQTYKGQGTDTEHAMPRHSQVIQKTRHSDIQNPTLRQQKPTRTHAQNATLKHPKPSTQAFKMRQPEFERPAPRHLKRNSQTF